jgi:hypothetical protein
LDFEKNVKKNENEIAKINEEDQNEYDKNNIFVDNKETETSKAISSYFIFYHAVKRNKHYHKREYSKSIQ